VKQGPSEPRLRRGFALPAKRDASLTLILSFLFQASR
jgi:hypothetical protein